MQSKQFNRKNIGIQNALNKQILTSHESRCPFAYPAHKNDDKIFLLCPAVWNISWHTLFSIIGTCTSCKTDGTPPLYLRRPQPDTVAIRPVKSAVSGGIQIGTGT